jgi:hypothetical protein
MQISITFTNVINLRSEMRNVNADESLTLASILEREAYPYGEIRLSKYFAIHDAWSAHNQILPYVISHGRARWEVHYRDVTIGDMRNSIPLGTDSLEIRVGIPQAGGPDLFDPITVWRLFYSAVQTVDPVVGVGGAVAAIFAFVRRRVSPWSPRKLKRVYPGAVFSLVVARDDWAARELAQTCGISRRDAVNLLQLCRYKKTPGAPTYHRTSKTEGVIERLNAIQQYHD